MTRLSRWWTDLALGVRLVLGGGCTSGVRVTLTALGVGLGVAVLLGAASVEHAINAQNQRESARDAAAASVNAAGQPVPGDPVLLRRQLYLSPGTGGQVRGVELTGLVPNPPTPPGLVRLPAPGEIVVSPALAGALAAPGAVELRLALPERVVGEIGPAGLSRPGELYFYAGLPEDRRDTANAVPGIGTQQEPQDLTVSQRTLLGIAIVALLVPIGVLVLVATRVAAAAREQRLAAMRLVGASRTQVHRIAAGEALVGALAGLVAGAGLFLALRPAAAFVSIFGYGFYPADLVPDPGLVALIAALVPIAAVGAASLAHRHVEIDPLGVTRRATPPRRRLIWRLVMAGAGIAVLLASGASDGGEQLLPAGLVLLLLGVMTLVPWLVDVAARTLRPAGIGTQLAVRRLQSDPGTAARAVAGVVAVLTAGLTLQTVLASVIAEQDRSIASTVTQQGDTFYEIHFFANDSRSEATALAGRLRAERGVHEVFTVRRATEWQPDRTLDAETEVYREPLQVQVVECAQLQALGMPTCTPGQVFGAPASQPGVLIDAVGPLPEPGTRVRLSPFGPAQLGQRPALEWTVPPWSPLPEPVASALYPVGLVVAAGGALDAALTSVGVVVRAEPSSSVYLRISGHTLAVDRGAAIRSVTGGLPVNDTTVIDELNRAVLAGSLVIVLLAALSQLITCVDQTYERRRQLATLAVFGVRRRTLAAAVLWQTALPLLAGLVLAVPAALGTTYLLLTVIDAGNPQEVSTPLVVPWAQVGLAIGMAALLVMVVSLAALPALRRVTRPDAVRFE